MSDDNETPASEVEKAFAEHLANIASSGSTSLEELIRRALTDPQENR